MRIIIAVMLGLSLGWFAGPVVGERVMDRIIASQQQTEGWTVNRHLGRYDGRWLLRSIVARMGLGALVPEEALYYRTSVDANGDPLTGGRDYVIAIEPDQLPPADAFWSLSAYEVPSLTLPDNEINRFQVGDRTAELRCLQSGLLVITTSSRSDPSDFETLLPSSDGSFDLVIRLYEPRESALRGEWTPPEVNVYRTQMGKPGGMPLFGGRIPREWFESEVLPCNEVWANQRRGTE